MRPIVPLANLQRRVPEAGRIRTGIKTTSRDGKPIPKAIETFRFTSSDEAAIRQLAELYGGTAAPWKNAPTPNQWEVITEASEIAVVLPPDPLGGSPVYELWSAGGCQRRCDGETAQIPTKGPDGPEMADVPCLCVAKGEMACSPHTRLNVILPDVRFGGVWRYESAKSWAVATELPGMVALIQSLQTRGLTRALLAIEARKTVTGGETHRFTIPVLRVEHSMDALAAGAATVGALPSGNGHAEISPGEVGVVGNAAEQAPVASPALASPDDDVVDAEIVTGPMTASQQTTISSVLATLDRGWQAEVKAWWKGQHLPKLNDLDEAQAQAVMEYLAEHVPVRGTERV